ncbi:hypothetical protein IAQ61_007499 [Plenodomus lingam]|uniref:DUF1993 domain-containing protein n=1 Tax=Leptosphaeria maculans (strain JN3 / isolate v23.1.3 / race Av1-4-5-6-7-8) TaxID=985895 RepID=E5A5I9_LEPMJ|nr:hypothetical protein LEMA_P081260.1 [Plenodomus lingam JN3]KAH9866910.1 hypothetical protein IAQ61_007499 [Plenodomus lingam]CBX98887.1 hypothetical protein LEMA_P081260.1 [Plenodomus lingam JN3]
MSSVPFYELCVTPVLFGLKNALAALVKAQEHAKANNIPESDLLTARIIQDMRDFVYQIQLYTDVAKSIPNKLNPSIEEISFPGNEKSFAELVDRVQKTITFLEGIDPKSLEGREQAEVAFSPGGGAINLKFTGVMYIWQFSHPNFWFHVTTAYDILRLKGVPLGKMDFLNGGKVMTIY